MSRSELPQATHSAATNVSQGSDQNPGEVNSPAVALEHENLPGSSVLPASERTVDSQPGINASETPAWLSKLVEKVDQPELLPDPAVTVLANRYRRLLLFTNSRARYDALLAHATAQRLATTQMHELHTELSTTQLAMERREAELTLEATAEGSNDTQRKALARIKVADDQTLQTFRQRQNDIQANLIRLEATIDWEKWVLRALHSSLQIEASLWGQVGGI